MDNNFRPSTAWLNVKWYPSALLAVSAVDIAFNDFIDPLHGEEYGGSNNSCTERQAGEVCPQEGGRPLLLNLIIFVPSFKQLNSLLSLVEICIQLLDYQIGANFT